MRALNIAATGMLAQQQNVEVVSNNLANMNTTAFQRRRTEFQDLLYDNLRRVGSTSAEAGTVVPSGVQIGLGARLAAVYRIASQGNLSSTDNPFDLAIQGKGLFPVDLPDGTRAYTRDGTFQLNADGQVVTHDGYPVGPGLTIPADAVDVVINQSGEVLVKQQGQVNLQNVGQFRIVSFPTRRDWRRSAPICFWKRQPRAHQPRGRRRTRATAASCKVSLKHRTLTRSRR